MLKIFDTYENLKTLMSKEWIIFIFINIVIPHFTMLGLLISEDQIFRFFYVGVCCFSVTFLNIFRLFVARKEMLSLFAALYGAITILNLLSFPFASEIAFSTGLSVWGLFLHDLLVQMSGYRMYFDSPLSFTLIEQPQ